MTDSGCVDSLAGLLALKRKLAVTSQAVADLFPVDQILAVEYRYSGEILKAAIDQIVVFACTAYRWIWVEP